MCFGSKHERNDDPAPRPVQNLNASTSGSAKTSSYNNFGSYSSKVNGARPTNGAIPPTEQDYQGYQSQNQDQDQDQNQDQNQNQFAPVMDQSQGYQHQHQQRPPPQQQQYGDFAPPPGPPPQQQQYGDFAPPPGPPPQQQQYGDFAPPPGPPPGQHQHQQQGSDYAPPLGPPPGRQTHQLPVNQQAGDYAPPPGPPPPHSSSAQDWAVPPPAQSSPVAHDWQAAVPDTSLFPLPPALFSGYDASPANNATEAEANAGEDWCQKYPLVRPMVLDQAGRAALSYHNFRLMEPAGWNGSLKWLSQGRWEGNTRRKSPDRCVIGYPPMYSVTEHDPTRTGVPKTIYYEVKILKSSRTINLALGFTALPYPSFRLPGWHRGSLAIHGDDGHRYINDRWGGKDFTTEYRRGETYGVGMTFTPVPGSHRPRVDIFFTRNGAMSGGWDLHEETDAEQDLPVTGLEGFHDLSCAIGAFDETAFEVCFEPSGWLCRNIRV